MFACIIVLNAQPSPTTEMKELKNQEHLLRKEKRQERKELRKENRDEVSNLSKDQFYADFGDVKATWRRSDYFDEATFLNQSGVATTAYYDENFKLVGTLNIVDFSKIPSKAQVFIKKHYPGYHIDKVLFFDDNENNDTDMFLYGQQFDDEDNYFVELSKGNSKTILQVNTSGYVYFFQ